MKITMNLAEQQSIKKTWIVLQEIKEKIISTYNVDVIIDLPRIPSGIYLQKWLETHNGDADENRIFNERAEIISGLCRKQIIDFEEETKDTVRFTTTEKFDDFCRKIEKKYNALLKAERGKVVVKLPLRTAEKRKSLITRDKNGDYFYNGRRIEMSHETLYCQLFDILFLRCDQSGFISYEEIERELVKREYPESQTTYSRNKRINNAIFNKQQGLFRFAKVNSKRLQNKTPDGRTLIELVRGKGLKLNNQMA